MRTKPKWTDQRKEATRERMQKEHDLTWKQRSLLTEIHAFDDDFFDKYQATPKDKVTVFRGDGRGMTQNSLNTYAQASILPKAGDTDITFYGVLAHTHSNSSPGGMVSTTSDKVQAVEWASDKHSWGLVYEIELDEYIDVNWLLQKRNFRNRYEGQKEFLIPRTIWANEVKAVHLYQKGGIFVSTRNF